MIKKIHTRQDKKVYAQQTRQYCMNTRQNKIMYEHQPRQDNVRTLNKTR